MTVRFPLQTALLLCAIVSRSISLATAADRGAPWPIHIIDDSSRGADGVRLSDIDGDGLQDAVTGWEQGGVTRVYLNPGHAKSKQTWPAVTVSKTPSAEDAVFADLDGDGATDVVSCCEGSEQAIHLAWSPSKKKDILDDDKWTQEALPIAKGMTRWMFAEPAQIDGKHGVDFFAGGKGNSEIGCFLAPRNGRDLAEWQWKPFAKLGWVMSIVAVDMDGDGDLDCLISDRKGDLRGVRWFANPGPGKAASGKWRETLVGGRDVEDMFLKVADLDLDGLDDIVMAAKKTRIVWWRRLDATGTKWEERDVLYPPDAGGAKAVAVGDLDGDGDQDVVMSCESATPPLSGIVMLRNDGVGDGGEIKWTDREVSGPTGIKYDRIELIDLDGDGDLDLMTCEERHEGRGLGLFWHENPGKQ